MSWMDRVARDPVPWLLDPGNPSVRYQTLRHIFRTPARDLVGEQMRIATWKPVVYLHRHWDPYHFWGRADDPYFGGPVGSFGSLYLLAQLGAPLSPEIERTCENVLERGRLEDGVFGPAGEASAPWLSYTGIALQILLHFGYGDHPLVEAGWLAARRRLEADPLQLGCSLEDRSCRAGAVKMVGALIHRSAVEPVPGDAVSEDADSMVGILCDYLCAHTYDWEGKDAEWMQPRFPRYYDTDIVELAHVTAHAVRSYTTTKRNSPAVQRILQQMLGLQDQGGRWSKMKTTPALSEERVLQPSRWLTFEAIHALILSHGDAMYAPGGTLYASG